MTIRRLVELDGEYGGWLEVDLVKLRRVATAFKTWLLTVDPDSDPFGFLKKDLPIVDAVLDGSIDLPYKNGHPHNWEVREGLLPSAYHDFSAPFYNTIRGALYEPPQVIMKDGRYYAWAEFEEPPEPSDN
jgi:hypothetical protein